MNIIQINQTYNLGSTGKIMCEINELINNTGNNGYMVAGYSNDHDVDGLLCANTLKAYLPVRIDQIIFRLSGKNGYRYKKRTKEIIKWIEHKKPDIVHLHNIHGDWINLEYLFKYLKWKKVPVVWTLHDCWAFTGRCSYFDMCKCDKWKSQCDRCPNKKVYPISYIFDYSKRMYNDKKNWYSNMGNMTIVTPSEWLAGYIKESFLGEYPLSIIHNGIDLNTFRIHTQRSKYVNHVIDKYIILGVASSWSQRKGFEDFIKLDKIINHDRYQIVMVGLNAKQIKSIPKTIIGIARTNNQTELAELYSSANVFINPTYQDNYPTTNLEATACGTVCITYNTGGSPESIMDKSLIVPKGDVRKLLKVIEQVCTTIDYSKEKVREFAINNFDKINSYRKYIELYENVIKRK